MKHSRKTSILITALTVACLVGSFGIMSMADSSDSYNSQGKIVFDNNTTATTDDIIFDASDFTTIDTMITSGKAKLATSLNAYPNTNVQSLDTFDNLSTAIDNLTSVPDIYYYDKATEGDDCARYMYENGSYYPCDQYGIKTSETALTGTITVVEKDDTTEATAGETQLVKYQAPSDANLSAGYAGYVDKSFILGSGSDNISYENQGYTSATIKTATLGSFTLDSRNSTVAAGTVSITFNVKNTIGEDKLANCKPFFIVSSAVTVNGTVGSSAKINGSFNQSTGKYTLTLTPLSTNTSANPSIYYGSAAVAYIE